MKRSPPKTNLPDGRQMYFNFASETFMTEARAVEIFLRSAREHRRENIRHVRVSFKPFRSTLYSFRINRAGWAHVKFHLAFRRAPENVLEQAAGIIFRRRSAGRNTPQWAAYDAFVKAIPPSDFELPGARRGRRLSLPGPGAYQSLEESFKRVNEEYFQDQLARPELCWSPVRARRILGSYQERTDRLIVSRLFDSPKIPACVLDYLMYHELLHKFLGIGQGRDGRRCLHGREFHELERRFRFYEEARQYLKKI